MTEHQKNRLADKLVRLAYELEYDAARLRKSLRQRPGAAAELLSISSALGKLGRAM